MHIPHPRFLHAHHFGRFHHDKYLVLLSQTEGIGTIRSHQSGPQFEDDGLSSDEGESNSDDEEDGATGPPLSELYIPSTPQHLSRGIHHPQPHRAVTSPATPTQAALAKTPVAAKPPSPSLTSFSIPKIFPRKSQARSASLDATASSSASGSIPSTPTSSSGVATPPSTIVSGAATPTPRPSGTGKSKFRKSWGPKNPRGYNFSATSHDIVGIVMLEVQGASDLPKLKNSVYFRKYLLRMFTKDSLCSDEDGMGHGPFRGHLIREESLSYSGHSPFPEPYVG